MIWKDPNIECPEICLYVFCLINKMDVCLGFRAHSGWYIYTTKGKKYIHHGKDREIDVEVTGWREIPYKLP